jgi:hypothetical protein
MLALDIGSSVPTGSQMKKILPIFTLFLLGAVIGLALGIYLIQHKFIDNEKAVGMQNEEDIADDFARKEFVYADPQSAREALQYAIKIHTEMQDKSPLWGRPEKSELAWCYAKLSLIEESEGNRALAGDYMTQSEQMLTELGMKDSSEAHLRELLRRTPASDHAARGKSQ